MIDRLRARLEGRTAAASPAPSDPRGVDLVLIGAVFALLTLGTVEIFSASAVEGMRKYGDSLRFLKRHIVFLFLGLGAMWVGSRIHYRLYRRVTYPLLGFAVLSLLAVLFIGVEINGARRWIWLGPLSFQPVEVVKFALITYLAYSLSKKAEKVRLLHIGFVPHLLVLMVIGVLLMRQPDMGSSILLASVTLALLFVAGTRMQYLLVSGLIAAPAAYMIIVGTWRRKRLMAFLNPEAYKHDGAYQVIQSKIAIGSGGTTGAGLGEARQTLGYMPEGYNDFIMACVGEELGFIGFTLVLFLFGVLLWRGVRAALGANDAFGSYLAFGITLVMTFQALINTSVVLGIVPAKGITLPFVSYGGTSLVMSMFLIGVLLNIGQRRPPPVGSSPQKKERFARRRKQRVVVR